MRSDSWRRYLFLLRDEFFGVVNSTSGKQVHDSCSVGTVESI